MIKLLIALAIVAMGGLWIHLNSPFDSNGSEPINTARVAVNKEALENCRDHKRCLGGFVKWKDRASIDRISSCRTCASGTYPIRNLVSAPDDRLNQLEYVRLPGDPLWKSTAMNHALQFIPEESRQ